MPHQFSKARIPKLTWVNCVPPFRTNNQNVIGRMSQTITALIKWGYHTKAFQKLVFPNIDHKRHFCNLGNTARLQNPGFSKWIFSQLRQALFQKHNAILKIRCLSFEVHVKKKNSFISRQVGSEKGGRIRFRPTSRSPQPSLRRSIDIARASQQHNSPINTNLSPIHFILGMSIADTYT